MKLFPEGVSVDVRNAFKNKYTNSSYCYCVYYSAELITSPLPHFSRYYLKHPELKLPQCLQHAPSCPSEQHSSCGKLPLLL